jgi:hypothetical protein
LIEELVARRGATPAISVSLLRYASVEDPVTHELIAGREWFSIAWHAIVKYNNRFSWGHPTGSIECTLHLSTDESPGIVGKLREGEVT